MRPTSGYTPQQAAAITGVPLQTLKNAVSQRRLKGAVHVSGGRGRLDRPGVLAYAIVKRLGPGIRLPIQAIYDTIKADPSLRRSGEIAPGIFLDLGKAASPIAARIDAYDRAVSELIKTDPAIMGGVPCIVGTRIPAHMIERYLRNGETVASLRKLYPGLTAEQIEAAQIYAEANPLRGKPGKRTA